MAGKKGNSFPILFCNVVTPDGGPGVWALAVSCTARHSQGPLLPSYQNEDPAGTKGTNKDDTIPLHGPNGQN